MQRIVALCLLFWSLPIGAQEPWHPNEDGCSSHHVAYALLDWPEAPISSGGMRLAVQPDTGNGPTTLVALDPGSPGIFGGPEVEPFFLAAVGIGRRTCVIKRPLAACPAAATVLRLLRAQSIPIDFQSDSPSPLTVMHGDTYYLHYRDGQGNLNQWRFYGSNHPLQAVIDQSFKELAECIAPARAALDAR